jgi:hypothetical protein
MKTATGMGTTAAPNLNAGKIYRQKAESGNGFTETFHPSGPCFMILGEDCQKSYTTVPLLAQEMNRGIV